MPEPVLVDAIWRDMDKRKERFIRIIAVDRHNVQFRTCDKDGNFMPGRRVCIAPLYRFGKDGYSFVRNDEQHAKTA